MGLSASGVGSGLDVAGLVGQLLSLEQQKFQPKLALQTEYRNRISLYGALKSKLSGLQDALGAVRGLAAGTQTTEVTNGEGILTASFAEGTNASYRARVLSLAERQSIQSQSFNTANTAIDDGDAGTNRISEFTITFGDGDTFSIYMDEGGYLTDAAGVRVTDNANNEILLNSDGDAEISAEELAEAISNGAEGAGLSTKFGVSVIPDAAGGRLSFQSNQTGLDSAFSITGSGAFADFNFSDVDSGNYSVILEASNSEVEFLDASGAQIDTAEGQTNTITTDFGLTLNVESTSPDIVTIVGTFGANNAGLKEKLGEFVSAYNAAIASLKANQEKGAKLGREQVASRLEQGIRNTLNQVFLDEGGVEKTFVDFGISFNKDGVMSFKADKYDAAIAADPDAGLRFFGSIDEQRPSPDDVTPVDPLTLGLFTRLSFVVEDALASDGAIANRTSALQASIDRINDDKARFDDRLEGLEDRLFKQFTALDAALAQLQQSQSLLSQRLAALNPSQ